MKSTRMGCLDRSDSASYLGGISTRKLDQLATEGHIPRVKFGRKTVFRIADLDTYIQSRVQRLKTSEGKE